MIKKGKFYLSVLFISGMLCAASPARAQLVAGVSFDFLGDATAAVTPVMEQIQTGVDEAVKYVKEQVTKLKASLGSYFGKRKNAAEKVPGTKNFAESSVDIYDPVAVQAAVNELFLQYPSSDPRINKFYEKEAAEFYYDTMIEIQTASTKLEEQLNSLRSEIDTFANDAIAPSGGNAGSVSSSDENGNYYNLYLAHKKFNDVLKITEEVMALYSQYYVARAIYRKSILPAPYEEDGDDNEESEEKLSASRYFHSEVAFAQFVSGNVAATTEEKEEKSQSVKTEYKKATFSVPAAPEPQPLMAGSEAQFEALQNISEAQKTLNSAIEAHNTIKQLPEYRNLYKQYEMFKQLHEKAAQAVATSDKCVVQYIGRHYAQPEKVWYGSTQAPKDPTDYDNRSGLSGWAVTAFQVANADKSAGLDTDSFSTVDIGENVSNKSATEYDEVDKKVAQMDSSSALATPSQEESISDAAREVELLVWQIGAQAAKVLAEDQVSSDSAYGRAENPYPLWQDQKSFYNQYIDGKYENMKRYIRQMDLTAVALQIAEVINDDREDGTVKSSTQNALQKLSSYLADKENAASGSNSMVEAKKAALAKVDSAEQTALKPYTDQKENLLSQLDEVTSKISELNDAISEADSETESGKAKVSNSYNTMKIMNSRGDTTNSTLYAVAGQDFSDGSEQELTNTEKANSLRLEVKDYEKQRDEINEKLETVNEKIAAIEEDYINRKAAVDAEYEQKMKSSASQASEPTLANLVSELNASTLGLSSVVSKADSLVSGAKDYAIELIDQARQDIYALGDGLYETSNNGVVVARHKELIEDMKEMPKEQFLQSALTAVTDSGASVITTLLSGALNTALTENVCGKVSCNSADDEYFVGLGAKERDFKAPKAPEFERYPSPRDVVHFDATDYKNIKKSSDGTISRDSFLEYGGEIPAIWQQMLAEDAFVEKGVDLTSILEQGGESKYFMRGVLYPCRIDNRTVDIAASKVDLSQTSGQYLVSPSSSSKMPVCQDITLRGSLYYTVTDLELDKSVKAGTQETPATVSPSELGTLLAYTNQKLRFNETAYNVYERMLELEEEASGEDFEYEVRDNVYQKAMYSNNQIGNFLHFVDKENSLRKNVEELELSINDAKSKIKDMLSNMGFNVSENLNLANEEEYNYIRKKLIEYKNNLVGEAASKISGISTTDEVVKERYDKVNNTRAALVQDYDALVNIDTSTVAGSGLAESIKSERANQEVMSKSQDEALSAIKDEINNYEIPMCMAY